MAVIDALRRTPDALTRNPVILVVFGLFGLVQLPQLLAQTINPILAGLLSLVISGVMIFVMPFVQAGAIRMADDALDGRTSLDAFIAAGKEHYLSVFGAYLIVLVVIFGLGLVGVFGVAIVGTLVAGVGGGLSTGTLLVVALVGGVFALLYLGFAFLVQFYGQEIVINGASAIEGLKQSVGLVRNNVMSSLGFFLVVMVGSLVIGGGLAAASSLLVPSGAGIGAGTAAGMAAPTPSLSAILRYTVVYVVATALSASVFMVFAVAFWRELRGAPNQPDSAGSAGVVAE